MFRLAPEAEEDIETITLYIAEDNPSAAQRWYDEIYNRCKRLGEMPGMGIAGSDIRPELRTFPIVRVVHGARRWHELL